MIKVSVLYPTANGTTFDLEYYLTHHVPLVARLLASELRNAEVERGVGMLMPGQDTVFHVIGHLYFDSVDALNRVFAPNANEILGDIPNYTNSTPIVQISEVVLPLVPAGAVA